MAEWAVRKIPYFDSVDDLGPYYAVIGFRRNGEFLAAAVYNNFRGTDIELSFAAESPRWATRGNINVVFAYPFEQLGTRRVTSITKKSNKRVRKLMEGTGFKLEGVLRDAFSDGADAFIYGITKKDWLNGQEKHQDS